MSEQNLTLYDIETGLLQLMVAREEAADDPDLTPTEQKEKLEAINAAIVEYLTSEIRLHKIDNVAYYLQEFEKREAACNEEAKRLLLRATHWAYRREKLEEYVIAVMQATNNKKLEGAIHTLAVRKNNPSCAVDTPALVPDELQRTELVMSEKACKSYLELVKVSRDKLPAGLKVGKPEPMKSEILKLLKAGEGVPGCRLVTDKVRLEVG